LADAVHVFLDGRKDGLDKTFIQSLRLLTLERELGQQATLLLPAGVCLGLLPWLDRLLALTVGDLLLRGLLPLLVRLAGLLRWNLAVRLLDMPPQGCVLLGEIVRILEKLVERVDRQFLVGLDETLDPIFGPASPLSRVHQSRIDAAVRGGRVSLAIIVRVGSFGFAGVRLWRGLTFSALVVVIVVLDRFFSSSFSPLGLGPLAPLLRRLGLVLGGSPAALVLADGRDRLAITIIAGVIGSLILVLPSILVLIVNAAKGIIQGSLDLALGGGTNAAFPAEGTSGLTWRPCVASSAMT